jgi:hypothetical protein
VETICDEKHSDYAFKTFLYTRLGVVLKKRVYRYRWNRAAKMLMVHVSLALNVVVDANFFADIEVKGSGRNL